MNFEITQFTHKRVEHFKPSRKRHFYLKPLKFYTFDARSIYRDEPNIFHLDLRFDDRQRLKAFRIRGIGISKPAWISEEDVKRDAEANQITRMAPAE